MIKRKNKDAEDTHFWKSHLHHKAVWWAPSSNPSSPMTADLSAPMPSLSLQMTPRWSAPSKTKRGGPSEWLHTDNLLLNNEMSKELIVDFRRIADTHTPIHIKGTAVERMKSFKFLGAHISVDKTWMTGCSNLVKNFQLHLFCLRSLRKNHISSDILVNFCRCTNESIMTNCITVWWCSYTSYTPQRHMDWTTTYNYLHFMSVTSLKPVKSHSTNLHPTMDNLLDNSSIYISLDFDWTTVNAV